MLIQERKRHSTKLKFFLKNSFECKDPPHRKVKGGENDRSTSLFPCSSKKGKDLVVKA
jgi:hypothetical protein